MSLLLLLYWKWLKYTTAVNCAYTSIAITFKSLIRRASPVSPNEADQYSNDWHEDESSLVRLPPELLASIGKFLDPVDQAVLSVCSRGLRRKLDIAVVDSRAWRSLCKSDQQTLYKSRHKFLTIIADRYPRYFVCNNCLSLHYTADVELPGHIGLMTLPCGPTHAILGNYYELCGINHYYTGCSLHYWALLHVQLAMERHRKGIPYGIDPGSLALIEIWEPIRYALTTAMRVSPRIVHDTLLLRFQTWTFTHNGSLSVSDLGGLFELCSHIYLPREEDLINCKIFSHRDGGSRHCPTCYQPILRCRVCALEFHVAVEELHFDVCQYALVVTAYLDVGRGEPLPERRWWPTGGVIQGTHAPVVAGADLENGCQARFEQQQGKSRQEITAEMRSTLLHGANSKFGGNFEHSLTIFHGNAEGDTWRKARHWRRHWTDIND